MAILIDASSPEALDEIRPADSYQRLLAAAWITGHILDITGGAVMI